MFYKKESYLENSRENDRFWKQPIIYDDRCTPHYFLIEINVKQVHVDVQSYNHYRVHYFVRTRSCLSLYLRFERSQLPRVYVSLYREVLSKLIRPSNRGRGSVMPAIFGHPIIYMRPGYTDQFLSLVSERALINVSLSFTVTAVLLLLLLLLRSHRAREFLISIRIHAGDNSAETDRGSR